MIYLLYMIATVLFFASSASSIFYDLNSEQGQIDFTNTYMLLDAIAKFVFALSTYLYIDAKYGMLKSLLLVVSWIALTGVLDELFFDPTKFQWNEWIMIIFACCYLSLSYGKHKSIARNSGVHR